MPRPHFADAVEASPEPDFSLSPGTSRIQASGLPAPSLLLPTPFPRTLGPSRAEKPGSGRNLDLRALP